MAALGFYKGTAGTTCTYSTDSSDYESTCAATTASTKNLYFKEDGFTVRVSGSGMEIKRGYDSGLTYNEKLESTLGEYDWGNKMTGGTLTFDGETKTGYITQGNGIMFSGGKLNDYGGLIAFNPTPMEQMKSIIAARQFPEIFVMGNRSRNPLKMKIDEREARARMLARRILGEVKFRDYLANGFLSVRSVGGRIYQIWPGKHSIKVWERGRHVQSLCVYLSGAFCKTDDAIMKYVMVLNDEAKLLKAANVTDYKQNDNDTIRIANHNDMSHIVVNNNMNMDTSRPLTEIMAELKARVAA